MTSIVPDLWTRMTLRKKPMCVSSSLRVHAILVVHTRPRDNGHRAYVIRSRVESESHGGKQLTDFLYDQPQLIFRCIID